MNSTVRQYVAEAVVSKLREILCDNNAVIQEADYFVSDLKIISDDLSFTFIPDLEDKFEVKGLQDDWYKVHTVGDSIELLTRLCTAKTQKPLSQV